ncbi:MAG: ADP-dependent glucokinase/phosphofructokinase, partial [bacterium]|nr:ADP-dependent glucokinase/phosphofructokinase [bacterium]
AESLEQASVWESGMGMWEDLFFTLIPSKFVTFPVFTVGLGDTISAGAFLTE